MTTPLATRLFTRFYGESVGVDKFGNAYFRYARRPHLKEKRWVIYRGEPDGSAIPPEWQGWLTHTSISPPTPETSDDIRDWMKDHTPNPSGTPNAFIPPGASDSGFSEISLGNYEPWSPD